MSIHVSLLALYLAGGGLIGVIAGLLTVTAGWQHDWLITPGVIIAVLGVIAIVVGVGGQAFLWISAALGN